MVNKAALSVLGVIVLVSMGVGVLIGMQIGGGGADTASKSTPTADVSTDQRPGGSGPESPAQTTIPGGEIETPQSPDEPAIVPARRFERQEITSKIKELVNKRRTNRDLATLNTGGQISKQLDAMARSHSIAMADEAKLSHSIDGNTSRERYETAGLYGSCQFESNPGTYVVDARYNRLEVIGHVVAGRQREGQFLETEEEVARAIVSEWFSGNARDRLLYQNAGNLGVGVEITQSGDVYATGNLC